MSKKTKSIVDEEERKKLIEDIGRMKDTLDSFKYGLNFEEFADEIFNTVDRQTAAINRLDRRMNEILTRMKRLEERLDEGIRVTVAGVTDKPTQEGDESKGVAIEETITATPEEEEPEIDESHAELKEKKKELETKIARLFERENELSEMAMNDPAGAEEYEKKAAVARQMRDDLEEELDTIREKLD
ncbi:MAG: hypothetical protein GF309_09170 [Candidatus Lokiarchaeota archaeon]|nr:hypothetical protein [Candidatus Lokiarchaeota archaeon]